MDPYIDVAIGNTIRDLRKYLGISQKELSEGICTQSLISQIEHGSNIPNSILLKQIAERLGVTLDGLLIMSEYTEFDSFKKLENKLLKMIEANEHSEALQVITAEKQAMTFENMKAKQFILWAEGVCQFYSNNNFTLAIELLKEALDLSTNLVFSYQDAQILNSRGILYAEENLLEEAIETFKSILSITEKLSTTVLSITSLLPKVCYNLSKVLTMQERYEESIRYSKEGIKYSEMIESISSQGELYYQIGLNYKKMKDYEQSLVWLKKSRSLFDIKTGNEDVKDIITDTIEEVRSQLEEQPDKF